MVKTFLNIRRFKTLRPRRIRGRRAERRKALKIKEKKKEKKAKINKIHNFFPSLNTSTKEDILSKYSKDRIEFLLNLTNKSSIKYINNKIKL